MSADVYNFLKKDFTQELKYDLQKVSYPVPPFEKP